jgi:DNA-binding MarR family transcriptional regulator
MTEPRWLNEEEDRAWRGFQRMSMELAARLHRRLVGRAGLSLSDYEVLVVLSESGGDRLRPYELGDALTWEKSRLSHHLSRMEKRGLIERRVCPSDARGHFIALTPRGREAIEVAAPCHVDDVRRLLIDHMTPQEMAAVSGLADKVLANLAQDTGMADDSDGTIESAPA